MKISKVTYIENGYFSVNYGNNTVVQDIGGIKLTVPTDPFIKEILMFLRTLKLEKLQSEEEYDDLKYRDHIVADNSKEEQDHIKAMMNAMSKYSTPSSYDNDAFSM